MQHQVYFWLKEEFQNEAGRARMEAALEALGKSPNITKGCWGKPAATPVRPVTDHSWDYGISYQFDTMAAHDRYQEDDAIHDSFIEEQREMWAKVLVMDLA